MIDIDQRRFQADSQIDLPIHADLKEALTAIAEESPYEIGSSHGQSRVKCRERRARYPVEPNSQWIEMISAYGFLRLLFDELEEDDIIVTGDGTPVL